MTSVRPSSSSSSVSSSSDSSSSSSSSRPTLAAARVLWAVMIWSSASLKMVPIALMLVLLPLLGDTGYRADLLVA